MHTPVGGGRWCLRNGDHQTQTADPNSSYGTGIAEMSSIVIAQAQEAGAAGSDSVFAMDHFDHLNLMAGFDELPHRLQVVDQTRPRCSTRWS